MSLDDLLQQRWERMQKARQPKTYVSMDGRTIEVPPAKPRCALCEDELTEYEIASEDADGVPADHRLCFECDLAESG